MTARVELWLYMAQRLSAMVLAPIVLVHLLTILYAIRGGLTAAEILGAHARQRLLDAVLRPVRGRRRGARLDRPAGASSAR